ncbi:hypothetical protein FOZ63_019125, partial [Perkinsus olseni]
MNSSLEGPPEWYAAWDSTVVSGCVCHGVGVNAQYVARQTCKAISTIEYRMSGSAAHLLPEPLFKAAFNFARAPTDHREAHRLVASRTSVGSNSSRLSRFFLQLAAPTHGHIAVDEMERAFSQHTNPETARDLVVQLRKDGRGHIGFSEFVAAVTYR